MEGINQSILDLDWDDDCYGVISLDDDYEWFEIIYISMKATWFVKEIHSTEIKPS